MINPDVEEIETVQLTDDVVDNEVLELDQNEEFQQVKQNFLQEDINKIIDENINFEKLNNPDEFMADELLFAGPITGITKLINPVIRKSKEVIEEGVYSTLKEKLEKPVDLKGAADLTGRTQRGEISEQITEEGPRKKVNIQDKDLVDTAKFINKTTGKTPDETEKIYSNEQLTTEAKQSERELVLDDLPEQDYEKLANSVNGINLDNESVPQKILPNIDYIALGDGTLQRKVESYVQEQIQIQKVQGQKNRKITVDALLREADAILSDSAKVDEITNYLIQRQRGDKLFANTEALAARNIHVAFQLEAIRLSNIATESGNDVDIAKAHKAAQIAMMVTKKISETGSDAGLTLFVHQIPVTDVSNVQMPKISDPNTRNVDIIVNEDTVSDYFALNGGEANVKAEFTFLQNLPTARQKNNFLDRVTKTTKETRSNLKRSLVETYQSALLSSPVTHTFNIVGTGTFLTTLLAERALTEPIKTLQGKSEAFIMIKSMKTYFPQMIKAFAYGALTEKSLADTSTRLDAPTISFNRQGFRLKNRSEDGDMPESLLATFIDGLGIMTRLQGIRPMIAFDEFFKAMARGMEIDAYSHRLATRATDQERLLKRNRNLSQEQLDDVLNKKYQEVFTRVRHSEEAFEQGAEFARIATFQDDLPKELDAITKVANLATVKIFFPFYKSPTNIVRRLLERSPLAFPLDALTRRKIFNNKKDLESIRQKKEALVRIALGTGTGAALVMLAKEHSDLFRINGYGPSNKKERSNWLETNRPYSIGLRKSTADDWTWSSYARYEPIAGVLAMAADTAYMLPLLSFDNPDLIEDATLNLGLHMARYPATALPMLQFAGELYEVVDNYSPEEDKIKDMIKKFGRLFLTQSLNAGYVVGRNISSLGLNNLGYEATKERAGFGEQATLGTGEFATKVDSNIASLKTPKFQYKEVTVGPVTLLSTDITRSFYKFQNDILARTLGGSSKLPPQVNHWFEEKPQGKKGIFWALFPLKMNTTPSKKYYNAELDRLGYGIQPHRITHYGVRLNNEQFHRFVELYNYPERSKFGEFVTDTVPAKTSFSEFLSGDTKLKKLKDNYYPLADTRLKQQQLVDAWHNQRTAQTRDILFQEYPELKERQEFIEFNKSEGKDKPLRETTTDDKYDLLKESYIPRKITNFISKFKDRQGE